LEVALSEFLLLEARDQSHQRVVRGVLEQQTGDVGVVEFHLDVAERGARWHEHADQDVAAADLVRPTGQALDLELVRGERRDRREC
jgi:hypothetical protein